MKVQLKDIAHGRCGDKSDTSNICIYARKPQYYKAMEKQLTADAVRRHFEGLVFGDVVRYDVPQRLQLRHASCPRWRCDPFPAPGHTGKMHGSCSSQNVY